MRIEEKLEILSKFLADEFEIQSFKGVSLASNRWIMVGASTDSPDSRFGEQWMGAIPPAGEGIEVGFYLPNFFICELQEVAALVTGNLSVGIFKDGIMAIWDSMTEEQKKSSLARLNLGLFSKFSDYFEKPYIRLWIRGEHEPIRFEFLHFFGAVMPMRKDRD